MWISLVPIISLWRIYSKEIIWYDIYDSILLLAEKEERKGERKNLHIQTIDSLGISELKLTGMGEFNSEDPYIYYCGQESLSRKGVALISNKSLKCSTWMQLKNDRMISVHFQDKPFNVTVIQVYAPTSNAEEADVEPFYDNVQDLLELTPTKDVLFIVEDWNAKVGNQEIPGITGNLTLEYKTKQVKG